eukprot:4048289-Prymnesium_polylepis.1
MASARPIRAPTAESASATDRSPTASGPSMHEGRAGMHGSAMARALRVAKWVLRAPPFINAALAPDERPPAVKRPQDPPEEGARSSRRHRHGAC